MADTTNTTTVPAGGTVTVVIQPAPVDETHIADLAELWVLFLVAGVVVFCTRRILDLFRTDVE